MKNVLTILILSFIFSNACIHRSANHIKEPILLADREAPLGWIYLRIYEDSTFEFVSAGLRSENIFPGKVKICNDTMYFHYNDSIPKAGKTAVFNEKIVAYIDGEYHERVEIKLNKIKK